MTTSQPVDIGSAYRGSRALVLGAGGFIGRWVARGLTRSQARLAVAVRDPAAFERIAGRWNITADVFSLSALDELSVAGVVRDADPDIVFNLVGYGVDREESDSELMWRINRDFVRHAALALAQSPTSRERRFVHVGSALEYGLLEGVAMEERDAEPHTPYGKSKLEGTNALGDVARETGLQAVTARAFTVFGPGEHPGRLLPTLRRAAIDGTPVRLSSGAQRRDFCYVEDVAEGLLRLGVSTARPGEVVNLATGRLIPVREFAETAARVLGLQPEQLNFGAESIRNDEMRITGVDVRRLEAWTGWTPPKDLETALRRAADFEAA
jgi:nucleoside-diphosphate-sugar epimerase